MGLRRLSHKAQILSGSSTDSKEGLGNVAISLSIGCPQKHFRTNRFGNYCRKVYIGKLFVNYLTEKRTFPYLDKRFNPCHGYLCDNSLPLLTTRFPKPFRQASFAVWIGENEFQTCNRLIPKLRSYYQSIVFPTVL
ncbi:hypothetical protein AVEN_125989-1 [Araneus ventricosus]|uniref:Uncharacterized protein n=1 Tax=Araneus ventricosus TaxID=182803 RepID=A0A4Y2W3U6_ARAVE|nr:hypothetical protein AVEN_125989-1 [Araneus ventricosus]